jgi:MFS family permease
MLISLAVYAFTDLSMTSFIIVSILAGIGSAGLVGAPLRFIMLAESGASDRASAQGIISVTSSMGRIFGASAVGAVAASYGGEVVGYQAAFTGLVVLSIIVMLAAITLNSKAAEDSAAEAKLA